MKQSIFLSKVVLISKLFYLLLNNKYLIKKFYLSLIPMLLVFLVSMKNFSSNNLYNIINFKKANYDYIKLK